MQDGSLMSGGSRLAPLRVLEELLKVKKRTGDDAWQ